VYHSFTVQSMVAVLIALSFIVNILQTELLGHAAASSSLGDEATSEDPLTAAFAVLEYFFTFAFTLELAVNLTAHFFFPFFQVA
jgi:hypothetical protein